LLFLRRLVVGCCCRWLRQQQPGPQVFLFLGLFGLFVFVSVVFALLWLVFWLSLSVRSRTCWLICLAVFLVVSLLFVFFVAPFPRTNSQIPPRHQPTTPALLPQQRRRFQVPSSLSVSSSEETHSFPPFWFVGGSLAFLSLPSLP